MQKHRFTVKRPPVVLEKASSKRVGLSRDALPHGSWVRRQSPGFTFANLSLPDPDVQGQISTLDERVTVVEGELDCLKEDVGLVNFNVVVRRCRAYPYDVTQTLNLADGGAPNVFGAYGLLLPVATYNFGDVPNRVQLLRILLELMSANDTYIMEFAVSDDGGVTFSSIRGAVRFRRGAALARTFPIDTPCRPFNNDRYALYGRLKSALGGGNVTFGLCMARFIPTDYKIPLSTGTWPWG